MSVSVTVLGVCVCVCVCVLGMMVIERKGGRERSISKQVRNGRLVSTSPAHSHPGICRNCGLFTHTTCQPPIISYVCYTNSGRQGSS